MTYTTHDLALSLGTNCALAYNLRYFYGLKHTGLLDWTITPLSCLPTLIRNRFALVTTEFNDLIDHIQVDENDSVIHIPTGILLHHAFTRDKNGRISPHWRSEIDTVAEKLAFLGSRMDHWLNESRFPALFINGTGWHNALSKEHHAITLDPEIYIDMFNAINETYPACRPTFCLLNGHRPSIDRAKETQHDVRVATIRNYGDWHEGVKDHWAGCKSAWIEAFVSLHIKVSPHDAQ